MSDYSHEHEAHKGESFDGSERDFRLETQGHHAVLEVLRDWYPGWVREIDLRGMTGYASADRRGRELAEAGVIDKVREGRFRLFRLRRPGDPIVDWKMRKNGYCAEIHGGRYCTRQVGHEGDHQL